MASQVFFMNDRASSLAESTPFKALKLVRDIGLDKIVKPGYKVAIKMHMGEYGNSLNLRPQWVSVIVDEIKRLGGYPYVVDDTTVTTGDYSGRATAEDHLRVASSHGFNEATLGCPVLICDGDFGLEDVEVEVPHGVFLKKAYMGKKFMDFDSCVVISHFKGHSQGVYGGAIKNMGIGMGSKRGKIGTHFYPHPEYGMKSFVVNQERVKECANAIGVKRLPTGNVLVPKTRDDQVSILDRFLRACPYGCLKLNENGELDWDVENCCTCNFCWQAAGQFAGIMKLNPALPALWPTLIADSAAGYMNAIGNDRFLFINYAFDITPICDCAQFHDRPMIPNLGVFVSFDPVAVDMACLEACEASRIVPGSRAEDFGFADPNTDRFTNCSTSNKVSQWTQINAAVFNGMGTSEYVLVESVPGEESDYWLPPYTPEDTFYMQKNKYFKDYKFTWGDYYYEAQRVSNAELFKRPSGMVGDISIKDLEK